MLMRLMNKSGFPNGSYFLRSLALLFAQPQDETLEIARQIGDSIIAFLADADDLRLAALGKAQGGNSTARAGCSVLLSVRT
jgi:hypothetical protein